MCACNLDYSKTILFAPSCICWVQGSVKYRTRKTSTFLSILLLNKINIHYFTALALIFFFLFFFMICYFALQHCPLWINDFAKRALVTINWYKNSEICIFAFIAAVVKYLCTFNFFQKNHTSNLTNISFLGCLKPAWTLKNKLQ